MPRTTIRATTADLGDLDLGDTLVAIVELEVDDEGRRTEAKAGTVDYRRATITDVFRLEADDATKELLVMLRRRRREAEEEATGAPVVPGLEGWLDAGGVLVTEADRPPDEPTTTGRKVLEREGFALDTGDVTDVELEEAEAGDVDAWVALGERVHYLRAMAEDAGAKDPTYREEAEALFVELNNLVAGEEVIDSDTGLVIIGVDGEARDALNLPDFERRDSVGVADVLVSTEREPITLDGPGLVAHLEKASADRAAATTTTTDLELPLEAPTLAEPLGGYAKLTADRIIEHLKALAEVDDPDAVRRIIGEVERYEVAHKARKGVLNRLAGILPPPLPNPDEDLDVELELDAADFEPTDTEPALEEA